MARITIVAAGIAAALLPCVAMGQGDAQAGKARSSMCIGCHEIPRYQTTFPRVYHVPKIIGQSSGYIESALRAYRSGDRSHPTMRAIARSLSDNDIADLAAYYGTR